MLETRIRDFIQSPSGSSFEALALELFADQFERLRDYQQECRGLGVDPKTVAEWRNVPPSGIVDSPLDSPGPLATAAGTRTLGKLLAPSSALVCLPVLLPAHLTSVATPLAALAPTGSFLGEKKHIDRRALRSWFAGRQRDGRAVELFVTEEDLTSLLSWLERQELRFRLPTGSTLRLLTADPTRQVPSEQVGEQIFKRLGLASEALSTVWCLVGGTPLVSTGTRSLYALPHWVGTAQTQDGLTIYDLASFYLPAHRLAPRAARLVDGAISFERPSA